MGPIERALHLLRSAGVVEVTLRVDLGRASPSAPPVEPFFGLDRTPPGPTSPAQKLAADALADVADEFSHTGARVTRDAPPRPDDGDEEGDDGEDA